MTDAPQRLILPDGAALADMVATLFARAMNDAVARRGVGIAALSGGRTPRAAYAAMATFDLPWEKIVITETDERWVGRASPHSNARMICETLLQGAAAAARFVPLKSAGDAPEDAACDASARLRALPLPLDFVLVGAGEDGHFASLFPDSPVLDAALAPDCEDFCIAVPAGENGRAPDLPRLSLTLAVIARARAVVLLVSGDEKRKMLDAAMADPASRLPLRALLNACPEITIAWAPQ